MQSKPKIREFTVDNKDTLQSFLLAALKSESRNKIKALLKYKAVFVNGKIAVKYDHPLKSGDRVEVRLGADPVAAKPPLTILYEDDELIVVDKPAGMLSIATENERDRTAYHLLMEYVREKDPQSRIFVVHRLDRDTSGVLVVAKNEDIKLKLQDNWAKLVTTRGYVAVVEGVPLDRKGRLHSWLKETKTHLIYVAHGKNDGLEAITNYEVIAENGDYSMLRIGLETGRKNQIRAQMQYIGNSIVGDRKYGAHDNPLKRLCLHADRLSFTHPITGVKMDFEAPIPKGFKQLCAARK